MTNSTDAELFGAIADRMASELALDASGHDIHHAWRVFSLGRRLADKEGADGLVVGAAALTHDLHRVVGGDEFVHPRDTLPTVRDILENVDFPTERIEAVCHCVAVHEEYDFDYGHGDERGADTIEAAIIQDADNLDAIGAVGIARAFAYGGAHDNPMWTADPSPDWVAWSKAETGGSTLEHLEEKLVHLQENMNTDTGRRLAAERHAFLLEFRERFEREWVGEA
ncbi:metal dependent phosphohydrolase [Natrialba chahannaoensis JCM 10990]|uniref:Metal dependent phosphohydrolase n=1 Tax=Natrialba chahannaoensis JCM 10990 TaxID=1227492 RepID=M0A975_9EURY|nr:HD domain-containing protein [Natrialba chahannaoensis]ELY95330.1 metal dependent phosphohydrolase [Natrialba chahannaoensis JCM 10990]